jgi:Uma2 family endonuclease
MASVVLETDLDQPVPRKTWTIGEVEKLELAGIIHCEDFELIEGELVKRMGRLQPHVLVAILSGKWLREVFGYLFVADEATLYLNGPEGERSAPQPDLMVLKRAFSELEMKPTVGDLLMVLEISATTLTFDLTTKASLYARAGVPEYWVMDVVGRRVVIHRKSDGTVFREVGVFGAMEEVAPLARPEARVRVADLFVVATK